MLSARFVRARRLTAALLVMCLGLFSAESLIADSCDADSARPVVSAADGVLRTSVEAIVAASTDAPAGTLPSAPRHAVHVCHCVHAHAGAPIGHAVQPLPATPFPFLSGESDHTPPSNAPEPPLRPPLV